jgi:hypothetical protein
MPDTTQDPSEDLETLLAEASERAPRALPGPIGVGRQISKFLDTLLGAFGGYASRHVVEEMREVARAVLALPVPDASSDATAPAVSSPPRQEG